MAELPSGQRLNIGDLRMKEEEDEKGREEGERGRQMYKGGVVTSVPHSTADPTFPLISLPMALTLTNLFCKVFAVFQEPSQSLAETRQLLNELVLQH